MTVAELIIELQQFDQSLPVVCREYVLLEQGDLRVFNLCEPRPDGWVPCCRPDKPTQKYLVLPG